MADTYDITIDQGATYALNVAYKDSSGTAIPLTGYSARMMVRTVVNASTTLLSLTSSAGGTGNTTGLSITAATGLIDIVISSTDTAGLPRGNAVYDLEIVAPSGVVTRLLEGAVLVDPEVTR